MTQNPTNRFLALAVVSCTALLLLVAGCGYADGGSTTTGPGGGSSDTTGSTAPPPSGADNLVFRVEVGGGFVPIELIFTSLPQISVYADGRVITQGPVLMIYPGPALPNLQVAQLSETGVQRLLNAAREAGLLEQGRDFGQPAVADGATTTFTVSAGGRTIATDVYFLEAENENDPILSDEQKRQRRDLLNFRMKATDLRGWLEGEIGPDAAYLFESLAVLILPGDPTRSDPSGIEPNILAWPLADLGTLGEPYQQGSRAVIAGDDLTALKPLLEKANSLTLWKSGDAYYTLLLRPLLPDEAVAE